MAGIGHNQPHVSINSLSTEDRKRIKNVVMELNDSMTRVAAEKDLQKQSIDNLYDTLGIDKKVIKRMAKAYFKANFAEESEANSNFEDFYTMIIKGSDNA